MHRWNHPRHARSTALSRVVRRFAYLGLALLATLLSGTVGFGLIEGYNPFEAFYMTLITVTTVGYRELRTLSPVGRAFNIFIILFGVTTLFFAIGVLTQSIIELQLREFFDTRRVRRMIDRLQGHFIVCGLGRVGHRAAEELSRAGAAFVVIELDAARVAQAIRDGMAAIAADSTRDQALQEAGVTRAKGLIAALTTDADNLFVILSAKSLNPKLHIAARVAEEEAAEKLRRAGADMVFAPYVNAGYQLAQSLLRPHVTQFIDSTTRSMGLDIELEEVRVSEKSDFHRKSLQELDVRRDLGVIVLAIRRVDGQMSFNPPAETKISGGDCLVVMGESKHLKSFEERVAGTMASTLKT